MGSNVEKTGSGLRSVSHASYDQGSVDAEVAEKAEKKVEAGSSALFVCPKKHGNLGDIQRDIAECGEDGGLDLDLGNFDERASPAPSPPPPSGRHRVKSGMDAQVATVSFAVTSNASCPNRTKK